MPSLALSTILTILSEDENEEVRQAAEKSLQEMPDGVVDSVLKDPGVAPKTIDFFARHKLESELLIESILLSDQTSDITYMYLAEQGERETNYNRSQ